MFWCVSSCLRVFVLVCSCVFVFLCVRVSVVVILLASIVVQPADQCNKYVNSQCVAVFFGIRCEAQCACVRVCLCACFFYYLLFIFCIDHGNRLSQRKSGSLRLQTKPYIFVCVFLRIYVFCVFFVSVSVCRMVASLSNQLTQLSQPNGPASPGGESGGVPASQGGVDAALAVQAVSESNQRGGGVFEHLMSSVLFWCLLVRFVFVLFNFLFVFLLVQPIARHARHPRRIPYGILRCCCCCCCYWCVSRSPYVLNERSGWDGVTFQRLGRATAVAVLSVCLWCFQHSTFFFVYCRYIWVSYFVNCKILMYVLCVIKISHIFMLRTVYCTLVFICCFIHANYNSSVVYTTYSEVYFLYNATRVMGH